MTLFGVIFLFAFVALIISSPSFAESQTVTPINEEISIEKIVTVMSVPEDNVLPWGKVRGYVNDPAQGYPVIIQFFKDEDPVHFAQVDVKRDGTYEYKFRVRNVDNGQVINIFEGDYEVRIFKVINSYQTI